MAIPATGALIFTPASIMDRVAPHTLAIELEPFDSVISDTTRSTYGKVAHVRQHRDHGALGETPVADFAALRRADAAGFTGAGRREV